MVVPHHYCMTNIGISSWDSKCLRCFERRIRNNQVLLLVMLGYRMVWVMPRIAR